MKFRPWSVRGGWPGAPTEFVPNLGTSTERTFGKTDMLEVERGDTITMRTAGAGGYGDPSERDPALVLTDVVRGLVSPDAARSLYGVAITGGAVDDAETLRLRVGSAKGLGLYDFGPERTSYEEVFTSELLDRLNRALYMLPTLYCSARRNQVLEAARATLVQGGEKGF